MRNRLKKLVAMILTLVLLTSIFSVMTKSSAESKVSFEGSFEKYMYTMERDEMPDIKVYTMELGETLDVEVMASVTDAQLTRVTINVDGSGIDRLASEKVSGSSWRGFLTLDSNVYPLNTPGTYTIKLFASADAGNPNWAELEQAILIITEPEISIDGSFGKSSYTMEVNDKLDIKVKASAKNAELTRVTVNVDGKDIERHDSKEIDGTSWKGYLTLDSSVYPLNVPGTYTIKLFVGVDAGDPNWAEVDRATLTVTDVQYDKLAVDIKDPGEVTPGDNLIVRSEVSGGSGNYSYLWTWTHPNGTELTDTRKNCSISSTVPGMYTFTLTVTDDETGESCTSDKLVVEVKAAEEKYDPMEISFVGGEDEVEMELAMAGMAAECSVAGGSGNFEYTWSIEHDGVNIQNYSYGMVDEKCTWKADKGGVYTFRVSVKDIETGLTKSASRSITVVQNEYNPLTLEITSAPEYAGIGETVSVSAETTGGAGDVSTSWEVYLGDTCIASGTGLTAQFVPASDGKYTVIVYAEDDAQRLEDRVTITAGSLVKCDLSVSRESLSIGEEVTAQVTVQDGIGPFSYSWMLYLDGSFVSSELDSEKTSYSWTAAQAGTYRLDCTVYDLGNEELAGEMVYATDFVDVTVTGSDTEKLPDPDTEKLPDPVVKVTVDGRTAMVTWDDIDGAVRYVYSLYNMTTNENVAEDAAANGLSVMLNDLETGMQYRVTIGAVPDGVTDTVSEHEKCSWKAETFAIPNTEKLPNPVVKVTVDGRTAVVTWDAIDGAARYVYSLQNMITNKKVVEHVAANGFSVTLNDLEPGTQYKVAIGAVPDGVTDTLTEYEKCSWKVETFAIPNTEKLPDPVVKVTVDGTTVIASWKDVPGAARYVFSLRKTSEPDGDPMYNHVETDGCSITLSLEPGVEYKLAVAAVPADVEDTHAETKRCSWGLATFTTDMPEEISTPKVLEIETDMKANFLLPGEEVTIKVTCNKATKYLDVYDPAYRTLKDPEFNKDGNPYFEYIVSYAATGKMGLHYVALDEQLEWSRDEKHQGFLNIIVCDHTQTTNLINTSTATSKDRDVHTVTEIYQDACLCGKVSNTWTKEVDKPHTWSTLQVSKTHTQGRGHRRFYQCTACTQVKDVDYVSFVKSYVDTCPVCRARSELIMELQDLLIKRSYSSVKKDGIFGEKTRNAMNAFRKDVMKRGPIDDVDEATMEALRNGSSDTSSPVIRWSISSQVDRTINIKVEISSGRLMKGEYYLLISNDGDNTYTRSGLFRVSAEQTSIEHTFDIYKDLRLTDGHLYNVAAAPLGWKSGSYVFPVGTIDLRDNAGFITGPSDGDPIAFFNTGALTVLWKKQPGCSHYIVELLEGGKQIFIKTTQDTSMLIKLSDIKSYTKDDWYVSHKIQINVTAVN